MAHIALHINSPQSLPATAGQAIALALRPVSQEIHLALEQAQTERALSLATVTLAAASAQLTTPAAGPLDACLHLLAIEIAASPLTCLADGTLQEALEVWIEHRAWRVSPLEGRRLADRVAQRLSTGTDVTWSQRVAPNGYWQASVWAPLTYG
ncbi:MAG: hypothetical protein WBD79_17785 [Anaerolineae bacterium]